MSSKDSHKFAGLDYLALGTSVFLALLAWFMHNMSATYSGITQYAVVAQSSIDGYAGTSINSSKVAARCELSGYQLLYSKMYSFRHKQAKVYFSPQYFHHKSGNIFFLDKEGLARYFHEIFGNNAKLEYFITDTVYFEFTPMSYRKVPVVAMTDITFRSQYMATGPIKIMPDSLLVYGNREQLRSVDKLNTKMIQMRDVNSDCFGEIAVELLPGMRISADKVGYSMPVVRYVEQEKIMEVRMTGAPIWLKFQIVPSTVRVTYRMPFSLSDQGDDNPYVSVSYEDFLNSRTGNCVGQVVGLPSNVLGMRMSAEVFSCILQGQ